MLVETDEGTVPNTMTRLLQHYITTKTLDLVGPYAERDAFTKKITTQNSIFIPFALIPHVMGQNLTPKATVRILVPVLVALGLDLPTLTDFLLAACTKTNDNNQPITVQDKSEVGVEHNLHHIFKVGTSRKKHILYHQIPSLQSGGADLGHAVSFQNITASTEGMQQAFVNNTNQCQADA